ncbi:MAG TPA: 6-phosphogluconolactonase [Anaerolineales bacterium]
MGAISPDVRVFDDLDALSQAAAVVFVGSCAAAIPARGRSLVALSGGNTPTRLYEALARSPYAEQVDWLHLHVFWGDERCVPPDDPQSNYRQAKDAFLSRVPLPEENIHRVMGELQPEQAAAAYARTIKTYATPPLDWPRFDLVLLGMGDDGHTAALFPGSPVEMTGSTAAVTADYEGRPANRVTLTSHVLNAARRVLFLISGESKSQTLAHVLSGNYQPEILPAQRIRPEDGELIWMVDRAAAGRL